MTDEQFIREVESIITNAIRSIAEQTPYRITNVWIDWNKGVPSAEVNVKLKEVEQ